MSSAADHGSAFSHAARWAGSRAAGALSVPSASRWSVIGLLITAAFFMLRRMTARQAASRHCSRPFRVPAGRNRARRSRSCSYGHPVGAENRVTCSHQHLRHRGPGSRVQHQRPLGMIIRRRSDSPLSCRAAASPGSWCSPRRPARTLDRPPHLRPPPANRRSSQQPSRSARPAPSFAAMTPGPPPPHSATACAAQPRSPPDSLQPSPQGGRLFFGPHPGHRRRGEGLKRGLLRPKSVCRPCWPSWRRLAVAPGK